MSEEWEGREKRVNVERQTSYVRVVWGVGRRRKESQRGGTDELCESCVGSGEEEKREPARRNRRVM